MVQADRDYFKTLLQTQPYWGRVFGPVYKKKEQLKYLKESLDVLQESTAEGNYRMVTTNHTHLSTLISISKSAIPFLVSGCRNALPSVGSITCHLGQPPNLGNSSSQVLPLLTIPLALLIRAHLKGLLKT